MFFNSTSETLPLNATTDPNPVLKSLAAFTFKTINTVLALPKF